MKIIDQPIRMDELKGMTGKFFEDMVKAVVDVEKEVIAVDAAMHADLEKLLLEQGSDQSALWGINFYPELEEADFVEFDSMINLRPWQNNRTRGVDDPTLRKRILEIIRKKITR